jgi:hypothetical protein
MIWPEAWVTLYSESTPPCFLVRRAGTKRVNRLQAPWRPYVMGLLYLIRLSNPPRKILVRPASRTRRSLLTHQSEGACFSFLFLFVCQVIVFYMNYYYTFIKLAIFYH